MTQLEDVLNQSVSELKHINLYILKYISLDVINTVFNSKIPPWISNIPEKDTYP